MPDEEIVNKRNEIIFLFKKGIESALPNNLFKKYLSLHDNLFIINSINRPSQIYNLKEFKNIYVTGAGKAASSMAKALENILGNKITSGIAVTKYGFVEKLEKIKLLEAAHPVPDENSVNAGKEILKLVNNAGEDDLIINLISGGSSALLTLPVNEISLNDKIATTKALLKNEASIQEINTIRKCISKVKGGGLIKDCNATVISLIISDVIGDDIEFIGSGLTVISNADFTTAENILKKYNLENMIPSNVADYINRKKDWKVVANNDINVRVENFLIGNNDIVVNKIIQLADSKGYNTYKLENKIYGEVRNASNEYFNFISTIEIEKPACIVSGGETTVNINGSGKGGRNQEFCLALGDNLNGKENIIILSGGTDGNDGPTDAAGAIIDSEMIRQAELKKIDYNSYLTNNDSYNFFNQMYGLVKTGPTLTNVMDVQISILF